VTTTTDLLEADHLRWRYSLFRGHLQDTRGRIVPPADYHNDLWDWLWGIEKGTRQEAFIGIWGRGLAKSTNAEMGAVALGARNRRRYTWYVSSVQEAADSHIETIADMLTSPRFAAIYPAMARRRVAKYGPRAWRRNRVTTDAGFTAEAIGLDKAIRGRRVGEDRPDLIILDDIDDALDGLTVVRHKIEAITRRILPAGSEDLTVIAIQNMIRDDGFFGRIATGEADYLLDRRMSGPIPAIYGLETEQRIGPDGDPRFWITDGTPSWVGFDLETAQAKMDEEGLSAFLAERQHSVEPPVGGMFDHLDFESITIDEAPELDRIVVWVDPAVSTTDRSDSFGISVDALGADGRLYNLWAWEEITTPEDALERAIFKAVEYGAEHVGIETDQGGDAWRAVYREAVRALEKGTRTGRKIRRGTAPRMITAKAGAQKSGDTRGSGSRSKVGRASKMLTEYERGRVRHVRGTHTTLQRALRRFPTTPPLDLVDCHYWGYADLRGVGVIAGSSHDQVAEHRTAAPRDDPYAADRHSRWQ